LCLLSPNRLLVKRKGKKEKKKKILADLFLEKPVNLRILSTHSIRYGRFLKKIYCTYQKKILENVQQLGNGHKGGNGVYKHISGSQG
jgi:hypothetical protein